MASAQRGYIGVAVATTDSNEHEAAPSPSAMNSSSVSLVCIHGLAGSSAWWAAVAGELRQAGPLYQLDLPRSLHPSDLPTWVVQHLSRSRVVGPVDLVGHSLGALIALRVAAAHPQLIRRLILISPPGITQQRSAFAFGWPLIASLTGARPSFLVRLAADASRAGPANILRGARYVASADATIEAEKVAAPTLLVWGAGDRLVPSTSATQWLELLADARLHVIPTAAHVPMVEAPEELAAVISKFRDER